MEKNKNIIILVLSIIIGILLIICTALYVENDYLEEQKEKLELNNNYIPNDLDNNSNDSINDDNINKDNYISKDKALSIALDTLKINKNDIYDVSNDLDYKYGEYVYEVEFKYNKFEYEFYINATTGKILKSFKEWD